MSDSAPVAGGVVTGCCTFIFATTAAILMYKAIGDPSGVGSDVHCYYKAGSKEPFVATPGTDPTSNSQIQDVTAMILPVL